LEIRTAGAMFTSGRLGVGTRNKRNPGTPRLPPPQKTVMATFHRYWSPCFLGSVRQGLLPSELAWESFVSPAKDLFDGLHDRDFEIFLLITEPFQFAQVLLEAL
jgi:hypothetical protein